MNIKKLKTVFNIFNKNNDVHSLQDNLENESKKEDDDNENIEDDLISLSSKHYYSFENKIKNTNENDKKTKKKSKKKNFFNKKLYSFNKKININTKEDKDKKKHMSIKEKLLPEYSFLTESEKLKNIKSDDISEYNIFSLFKRENDDDVIEDEEDINEEEYDEEEELQNKNEENGTLYEFQEENNILKKNLKKVQDKNKMKSQTKKKKNIKFNKKSKKTNKNTYFLFKDKKKNILNDEMNKDDDMDDKEKEKYKSFNTYETDKEDEYKNKTKIDSKKKKNLFYHKKGFNLMSKFGEYEEDEENGVDIKHLHSNSTNFDKIQLKQSQKALSNENKIYKMFLINKREKHIKRRRKVDYDDCLSLGICVRYAEKPFNKSKIVTFINRYIFINRLPFDIQIVTDSMNKIDHFLATQIKKTLDKSKLNDAINKIDDFNKTFYKDYKKNVNNNSNKILHTSVNNQINGKNINGTNNIDDINKNNLENKNISQIINDNNNNELQTIHNKNIDNKKNKNLNILNNNDKNSNVPINNVSKKGNKIHPINNDNIDLVSNNMSYMEFNKVDVLDSSKYNLVDNSYNKENNAYIRTGEIGSFHSLRNTIRIINKNINYISLPFSLIPKNVPTSFQIELFKNQYMDDTMNESYVDISNIDDKNQLNSFNNLLIEINICSGLFGDKQQLPYTYNGYFYILSLSHRPQFEIVNATNYAIAYITDFNKYTRKYINNNYSINFNKNYKHINSYVKISYPNNCVYYTLGNNDEIKNSKIALKIVGVQKSAWCVNSINSFIDNVVTIPYSIYGNKIKNERNRRRNNRIDLYSRKKHLINQNNKHNFINEEHFKLDNYSDVINMDPIKIEKEEKKRKRNESFNSIFDDNKNNFLGTNLINKKLYAFLIIRDNGSRAIVITANQKMAKKIVHMKNFSKIHKFIVLNKIKNIILNTKYKNRKYFLGDKKNHFIYFNFPNIFVFYNFNLPRITFTWVHLHNVIIAMYLTKLKYAGRINPKEILNDDELNQMFTPINILNEKKINEYMDFVFLNSYIDSEFLIEQIHIDHFVKGDIPVILKNTYIEGDEKKFFFLYVHIKQYCVDIFRQAPIYQSISIKMSPINANIELLVIEQLIEIAEKEKAILLLHNENKNIFLPPVIDTSKIAKNAINTTLKLFSDDHFLNMLQLNKYIKKKIQCNLTLNNKNLIDKNFLNVLKDRKGSDLSYIYNNKRKTIINTNNFPDLPVPNNISYPNNDNRVINMNQKYVSYKNIKNDTKDTKDKNHLILYTNTLNRYIYHTYGKKAKTELTSMSLNKKQKSIQKLIELLTGYNKYKKINRLIKKTYYNVNNINDENLLPIEIQYFIKQKIFMKTFSSHIFLHPNPKWTQKIQKPVYIREFKIYPIDIIASIRTSEHRISRNVLHLVDSLPVDTPSMRIHLVAQKRNYIICTWDCLFHSLRISYFRQLLRQSLPSAWLSNPFALITGFLKGLQLLFKESIRGIKTNTNRFDGFFAGFKYGMIILVVNTIGGLFHSISHMLNICHKLMGGSRPRPPSILDAIVIGFDGLIMDTFYKPWVALFSEPKISINKGNSAFKTVCITLGCILRCLFAPIFGLLNFFTSLTEGFANTLIGDFERFSRVQERAEFETKKKVIKNHSDVKKKKKNWNQKNGKYSFSSLKKFTKF